MTPDVFWDSSLYEVIDMIEASKSREQRQRKSQLIDAFSVAKAVAINISASIAGKDTFVEPWDFYGDLFTDYREKYEKIRTEREMIEAREKRRAAVEQYNRIRNKNK